MTKYMKAIACTILAFELTPPALAEIVQLTLESPASSIYQQQANRPCVIGDSSCQNDEDFPSAGYPNGNITEYDISSPVYTASSLFAVVGSTFFIGIDVNTAAGKPIEILRLFDVIVNNDTVFRYSGDTRFALVNNGNGSSDALLKTVDLSGIDPEDQVQFRAVVGDASDGKEQFFLIGTSSDSVPDGGMTVGLLGVALFGLEALRRKIL